VRVTWPFLFAATAGNFHIKLHIDTGVNKRIIKVDRVFCLKKQRLALALCRQTGTKKLGISRCRVGQSIMTRPTLIKLCCGLVSRQLVLRCDCHAYCGNHHRFGSFLFHKLSKVDETDNKITAATGGGCGRDRLVS